MKNTRVSSGSSMRKYYQLILIVICCVSVISLLIYRHEYYRLRYVLEVLNFFGKPGLSEIEFCGAGFNATLLTELLTNSSYAVRETPPIFQQIDENFYTFSSFLRHNPKYDELSPGFIYETDTIVVGKSNVQPKFRCNLWYDETSRPKPAKFTFKSILEDNNLQLYVFRCSTGKDFGRPVGISFYSNDNSVSPLQAPINQLIQINTKKRLRDSSSIKFVNNVDIAVCVVPNEIPLVSKSSLVEFLTFHRMMGVLQFTIYDSTISEDSIKRIKMLPSDLTKWQINFFPLNSPFVFSRSYKIMKRAVELDCTFRNLQTDKEVYNKISHLATLSWDEFLVPRYHRSLRSWLREYSPIRKLKNIEVTSLSFCLNQHDDDKVNEDYPKVVKKTSYYKTPNQNSNVNILNLDAITLFDGILELTTKENQTVPQDVMAVHKYSECSDGKNYDVSEEKLNVFPHKFEGAILKFADDFHNNKLYRLYRTGNIWERSPEIVHDAL